MSVPSILPQLLRTESSFERTRAAPLRHGVTSPEAYADSLPTRTLRDSTETAMWSAIP